MATILVIEDLPDNANLMRKAITTLGHTMEWAQTAEAGLEAASATPPDLILLDLGLPDMDGQVLIGWLRDLPELTGTPILVVTAWPPDTAKRMAEEYAFDGYIAKPFRVKDFMNIVQSYL